MVPRENKNNAPSKFGGISKGYHGIFRFGQLRYGYKREVLKGLCHAK